MKVYFMLEDKFRKTKDKLETLLHSSSLTEKQANALIHIILMHKKK